MADKDLLQALADFLPYAEGGAELLQKLDEATRTKLLKAMPGLKERAKTLLELKNAARFVFEPVEPDEKAKALLNAEGIALLKAIHPVLQANTQWDATSLETDVKGFAAASNLKLGQIAQPLRAALTGTSTSPGIFDVMSVLEKDETLQRIERYTG
jgi:glutamyl-tRNA synthetase